MTRFAYRICLTLGIALALSLPANAAVELLMDLINSNGSVVSGNIVFDQFSLVTDGDITAQTEVNVATIMDANGNYGIRFQGGLDDLAGNGPSLWRVSYRATSQGGSSFTGATLSGNPVAIVSGRGDVTLSATQITPDEYLNIFDDFNAGTTSLLDTSTFGTPATTLDVSVEFLADAGEDRGAVTASLIDQTFTQEGVVPEATALMTWTIMLFGAAMVVGWKRLQAQKDEAKPAVAKVR
ncbi:MAG: hypothetical protein KDB27_29960 [Planctomycetales bacterium]|nr:hypothetical protein [Planctomycetales bacterium]